MKVLVVGSGGREHAIAWKVEQSPLVDEVIVAPGNPGTAGSPRIRNVAVGAEDREGLVDLARREGIRLAVIGPEASLVSGVGDGLREAGVAVVGPGAPGARLEGSKAFAKEIMVAAGVPTAAYAEVRSLEEVDAFLQQRGETPLVVKADGLAAGKGVVVCDTSAEAREAARWMLEEGAFGEAGARLVLEERLVGIETSFIVLTDGERWLRLPIAQDHKRLLDGDAGPNTGGMGAYSPAPFVSEALAAEIEATVIAPTLAELKTRGIPFKGFLYAGLMLCDDGPKVLEFNARLGDPETQVLLAVWEGDAVPALLAAAEGRLEGGVVPQTKAAAVVVMAAEGYPTSPVKGDAIEGLDLASAQEGVVVFHAGTTTRGEEVVTSGGRVLGVCAAADQPEEAVQRAYKAVDVIRFRGAQVRRDIGKALGA